MRGSSNVVPMSSAVLTEIVSVLRCGGVIAIPTDTVYGLASLAQSSEGVRKLYAIKGRNFTKPVSICVQCISQIHTWARVTVDHKVLSQLLPGPVTAVLPRQSVLNDCLNPGVSSVGVRVIDLEFLNDLLTELKEPLALTSANSSGDQSTVSVSEFAHLHPQLDYIVDGGVIGTSREGSTVVDLTREGQYRIVRPGSALKATETVLSDAGLLKY